VVGRYQEDASRELAHDLLSLVDRPTAIFAANDLSAIAVLGVAAELGISVPDELSVIGFDDIPEAARHAPPLSTVRQPMQRLGEVATKLLIALMNGETPEQTHVRLPTRLAPRATTAPPLR
jgi:LacI family transcriptional regulator